MIKKFRNWVIALKMFWREKRSVLIVYAVLRLIVIAALVLSCLNGDYDSAFICVLVLVLFLVPAFIQDRFSIELPSALEIIILLFIFAAEILGELSNYYVNFEYWDTLLHTTWGFLCAAVGFSMVEILNRSRSIRFELSPLFLAICAFCFSMTIGVIWEFFEFGMDYIFHTVLSAFSSVSLDPTNSNIPIMISGITEVAVNGQELGLGGYLDIGLYDTMEDMFVNFIGALVFSIIGYIDVKHNGESRFAGSLIPRSAQNSTNDSPAPSGEQSHQ